MTSGELGEGPSPGLSSQGYTDRVFEPQVTHCARAAEDLEGADSVS